MSAKNKEKVTAESKRLGINSNEGKSSSTSSVSNVSAQNTIKQLRAQNKKQNKKEKRRIKASKRKSKVPENGDGGKDSDVDDGDQFGSKISKRKSKH